MKKRDLLIVMCLVSCAASAIADDDQEPTAGPLPRVALLEVLDEVSENTGRVFVVDKMVESGIVVGQADPKSIDYSMLLVILRNNALAAVHYDDIVSIINVDTVRQYPLPVIYEKDASIADEEWITMLIDLRHADAARLVPILRPMLPKQGHIVAHADSNTLTIVDRYGNVKRVVELIRRMDVPEVRQ